MIEKERKKKKSKIKYAVGDLMWLIRNLILFRRKMSLFFCVSDTALKDFDLLKIV